MLLSWQAGVPLENLIPLLIIAAVGVLLPVLARPTLAVTDATVVTYSQFGKVRQKVNLQKLANCKYLFNFIGGLGIQGAYEGQMSHVWHLRDADGNSLTFPTIIFGNKKQLVALFAKAVATEEVPVDSRTAKKLGLSDNIVESPN